MAIKTQWRSRAVMRLIEAGNSAMCAHCDGPVKFRAKAKAQQVICNVYVKGVWDRVEHYHAECYETAGEPYGEAQVKPHVRAGAAAAARSASAA